MSKGVLNISVAITKHSVCQPGRPGPHGESHAGSPSLEGFHKTKSSGFFLKLATFTLLPAICSSLFLLDKEP